MTPFVAGLVLVAITAVGCTSESAGGQAGTDTAPAAGSSPAADSSLPTDGSPATGATTHHTAATTPTTSRQTAITAVAPSSTGASATRTAHESTTSRSTVTTTASPTSRSTHPATAATPVRPPATHSTAHSSGPTVAGGVVVVIDPGHNGANAAHPEIINKQVPAGFGEYKNCNTTGTETNAGYPEYRFNWNVALAVRDALQAKGITVVMTRDSDDGVGPCVDKRAAIGNATYDGRRADAVVSIHGDGEAAGVHGFYVMTAARSPAGAAVAKQSGALAGAIRDGMAGAGFPISNTLGSNGIWQRSDLGGLNLSQRPTVMIECGNMRNAHEASVMSSAAGQQKYAAGIAAGIIDFVS